MGSFTRSRVERIITLAVVLGCGLLGAQAVTAALRTTNSSPADTVLMWVTFFALAVMLIACAAGRQPKIFAGAFAWVYVLALAVWPWATSGVDVTADGQPWIFFLINVATIAAVLAFRMPLQIAFTVATPLIFGLVRVVQSGIPSAPWVLLALDVSFAVILGAVLLALAWVFRAAAVNVDETRARAVSSYADAAAADAAESERIAVAALMHDSVLAALIAAERADSDRERSLAVSMAREGLTRLANAEGRREEGTDEPVGRREIADDIERQAKELGVELSVHRVGLDRERVIPGRVARAIVLAATQAVSNAIQHAGGVGLRVSVTALEGSGVTVAVHDDGPGVDLASIPDDRLGIRGSIFARLAAVGGVADLSSSGRGTTVTMAWAGHR